MQQTNIKKENKSNYQFIVFQEPGLELGGLTIFKDKSNKYAFIEFNNNEEDSVVMYLEKIQKFIDKRAIDAIQYYPDSYLVSGLYIMKCPHNGLFEGEVRNGKPFSGKGCIKHNNGSFSIGQWQDGDLTGKEHIITNVGEFIGESNKGVRTGDMRKLCSDLSIFVGKVVNNEKTGELTTPQDIIYRIDRDEKVSIMNHINNNVIVEKPYNADTDEVGSAIIKYDTQEPQYKLTPINGKNDQNNEIDFNTGECRGTMTLYDEDFGTALCDIIFNNTGRPLLVRKEKKDFLAHSTLNCLKHKIGEPLFQHLVCNNRMPSLVRYHSAKRLKNRPQLNNLQPNDNINFNNL